MQPAQTNLELYAQAIALGTEQSERRRLADAYLFALRQVFPLVRGSGKPFISHLVGTASLVMESGCPDDWVIAALLHALYQRRVPFIGGLSPESRRPLIARRFGEAVDNLVHGYTTFESQNLAALTPELVKADPDVVTLRMADELEDLCGYGPALHGSASRDESAVRGSYEWRRDVKTSESETLRKTAQLLGLSGISRGLSYWLDFSSVPQEMIEFRTGWFSSVDLASTDGEFSSSADA